MTTKGVLVVTAAFVALLVAVNACQQSESPKYEYSPVVVNEAGQSGWYIATLKHDGHLFIAQYKGGVINHPSCPHPDCKKK